MKSKLVRTGGGRFDPTDKHVYFIAGDALHTLRLGAPLQKYCLVAVNELEDESRQEECVRQLEAGTILFLDSGVFSLCSAHARAHNVTHDEALRTPLDEIDGFQSLYDRYVSLVKQHEDKLWGYVELDAGGIEQKRKTRAGLEALGLRPIPVYHPLNDGWDYFDELASRYDRICCGNVVRASRYIRLRILATLCERKKKYPHLWVHMLGMRPSEWANAYPFESGDSITWLRPVKWASAWHERAALKQVENFERGFYYKLGENESWNHAIQVSAMQESMNQLNWRQLVATYKELQ